MVSRLGGKKNLAITFCTRVNFILRFNLLSDFPVVLFTKIAHSFLIQLYRSKSSNLTLHSTITLLQLTRLSYVIPELPRFIANINVQS